MSDSQSAGTRIPLGILGRLRVPLGLGLPILGAIISNGLHHYPGAAGR